VFVLKFENSKNNPSRPGSDTFSPGSSYHEPIQPPSLNGPASQLVILDEHVCFLGDLTLRTWYGWSLVLDRGREIIIFGFDRRSAEPHTMWV
jgi:hypothetical protein